MAENRGNKELFTGAFIDELVEWGVSSFVVSPGSRSTPLSMVAYEYSRRFPDKLRLFLDIDERGAAFFALGIAKATGAPVALVCTSGSAVANYYPAVVEAEAARIPLIVLTGDRPLAAQGLGAPQTCDQVNAYGNHVKAFRQMPEPSDCPAALQFVRQAAREACLYALGEGIATFASDDVRVAGASEGGPVQLNFPFTEPLTPCLEREDLFSSEKRSYAGVRSVQPHASLGMSEAQRLADLISSRKAIVVAGEGSCTTITQAKKIVAWAQQYELPIISDILSGLRVLDADVVIDNYDSILRPQGVLPDELRPELIIRLGRFPVSKKATELFSAYDILQVVVDPRETRDFMNKTDLFVRCSPVELASSLRVACELGTIITSVTSEQKEFCDSWVFANDGVGAALSRVEEETPDFEGAYLHRMLQLIPDDSCLFTANSMSVRALDTFYSKKNKGLTLLCNRGLNGIDGVVSTALGAAQAFSHTTFVTGDLTFLHDVNALHLQHELALQRELTGQSVNVVIVLFNNNGGGIFDILAQKSEDDYYERLFVTAHDTDFQKAAGAFHVPAYRVNSLEEFEEAYQKCLQVAGINLIEVTTTCEGTKERYFPYWNR